MRVTLFTTQDTEQKQVTDLTALLASDNQIFWVDITGPDAEGLRVMHDIFRFHPLAIEDTRNHEQRPKVEEYAGYLFMIVNPVSMMPDHSDLDFRELDIFIGHNYIVTIHAADEPVIPRVHDRLSHTALSQMTVSYLLYLLLDEVVDGYFPIMDIIEEEISELEDSVLAYPRQQTLNRIFQLKRMLLHLWRVVWPERDILSTIAQPHILSSPDRNSAEYYLRDVSDHLFWIADMTGTFRDTLTGIIDLYMSSVSNRLNRVVNRLTIITLGTGLLAVITGFYGMNFERTWPSFNNPLGVPFVLLLIVMVIGVVLLIVHRMKDY